MKQQKPTRRYVSVEDVLMKRVQEVVFKILIRKFLGCTFLWMHLYNSNKMNELFNINPHYITRMVTDVPQIFMKSIKNQHGYVSRFDIWIQHKLKADNLAQQISIFHSLNKHEENNPFSKKMAFGDRKQIVYNNMKCKQSLGKHNEPLQITSKIGLHLKKVMLLILLGWKLQVSSYGQEHQFRCVLHKQLDKLNATLTNCPVLTNYGGIVFHHDNARLHISLQTWKT